MNNQIELVNRNLMSDWRSVEALQNENAAYKRGEQDALNQADPEKQKKVISAIFEKLKEDFKLESIKRKNLLEAGIIQSNQHILSYKELMEQIKMRLEKPGQENLSYSLFSAILYTILAVIFFLAEVGVTMETVANALAMSIEFEYMSLTDPASFEGLFLALAIAGIPFIAIKLWIDRYIIAGLYKQDLKSDRLFKWLLIPVLLLSLPFIVLTGSLRWVFQQLMMDSERYEIWKEVFMANGEYSEWGIWFMILLVLTLSLCGGISLSFGLNHLSGCFRALKQFFKVQAFNVKQLWISNIVLPRIQKRTSVAIYEREKQHKELEKYATIEERELEKLAKKQILFESAYEAGYNATEQKLKLQEKQRVQSKVEQNVAWEKRKEERNLAILEKEREYLNSLSPYLYMRRLILTHN